MIISPSHPTPITAGNPLQKAGRPAGTQGARHIKVRNIRKIKQGLLDHDIRDIGDVSRPYITRYRLDLDIKTHATEFRIHADADGKYQIPDDLKADDSYGDTVKAITAFLYSEGVVANDRICAFINSISGDILHVSTGSIYGFCKKFASSCASFCHDITQNLLNSREICTDATVISTDGKQTYIRNFSTGTDVLYCGSDKKDLDTLKGMSILKSFTGILTHDHETSLYHFGTAHAECNVHLADIFSRTLKKPGIPGAGICAISS